MSRESQAVAGIGHREFRVRGQSGIGSPVQNVVGQWFESPDQRHSGLQLRRPKELCSRRITESNSVFGVDNDNTFAQMLNDVAV